jgi:hypothetical protein
LALALAKNDSAVKERADPRETAVGVLLTLLCEWFVFVTLEADLLVVGVLLRKLCRKTSRLVCSLKPIYFKEARSSAL